MSIYKKHDLTGRLLFNIQDDAKRLSILRGAILALLKSSNGDLFDFARLRQELGIAPEHRDLLLKAVQSLIEKKEVRVSNNRRYISAKIEVLSV